MAYGWKKAKSYRYGYMSRTAKRAKGNIRASTKMRDRADVTVQGIVNVPIKASVQGTAVVGSSAGTMALSVWQLVMLSNFYDSYKTMYDQVKLGGFSCKVIGNSASSVTLASGLSSVGTVVAFDRNGVPGHPVKVDNFTVQKYGSNEYTPFIEMVNADDTAYDGNASVNQILSYGSRKSKPWSPGNAFTQYISGYAQTAQEMQEWLQTDQLLKTYTQVDGNGKAGTYYLGCPSGISRLYYDHADDGEEIDAKKYVNSDGGLYTPRWNPVVLLGVYNVPIASQGTGEQTFSFTIEYKASLSFRGLRSGIGIANGNLKSNNDTLTTAYVSANPGQTYTMSAPDGTVYNKIEVNVAPPETEVKEVTVSPGNDVVVTPSPGKLLDEVDIYCMSSYLDPETGNEFSSVGVWGLAANSSTELHSNTKDILDAVYYTLITHPGVSADDAKQVWDDWCTQVFHETGQLNNFGETWWQSIVSANGSFHYPDPSAFVITTPGSDSVPPPPPGIGTSLVRVYINNAPYVFTFYKNTVREYILTPGSHIIRATDNFFQELGAVDAIEEFKVKCVEPETPETPEITFEQAKLIRYEDGVYKNDISVPFKNFYYNNEDMTSISVPSKGVLLYWNYEEFKHSKGNFIHFSTFFNTYSSASTQFINEGDRYYLIREWLYGAPSNSLSAYLGFDTTEYESGDDDGKKIIVRLNGDIFLSEDDYLMPEAEN